MDYTLNLSSEELNLIGAALGELPAKTSRGLLNRLQNECHQQELAAAKAQQPKDAKEPLKSE